MRYNTLDRSALYDELVNLSLLHYAMELIDKNHGRFSTDCMIMTATYKPLNQDNLNFKYIGELLERYKDITSNELRDVRAMGLALALCRPVLEDGMFIGSQKEDFIREISDIFDKENDFLLALALLLLTGKEVYFDCLTYQKHSDILTFMAVYTSMNADYSVPFFHAMKDQLLYLIKEGRNFSVAGSEDIYWNLAKQFSIVEKPDSFVKAIRYLPEKNIEKNKTLYGALLGAGYTRKEICYLNYFTYPYKRPQGSRIALNYLVAALQDEDGLCELEKQRVTEIKNKFSLKIWPKVDDIDDLSVYLHRNVQEVPNPDTLLFLVSWNTVISPNSDFFTIDLLDEKYDELIIAVSLPSLDWLTNKYIMEHCDGSAPDSREKILQCVKKIYRLRQHRYLNRFVSGGNTKNHFSRHAFKIIVETDVIRINSFIPRFGEDWFSPDFLSLVWGWFTAFNSEAAFSFMERFIKIYDVTGFNRVFECSLCHIKSGINPLIHSIFNCNNLNEEQRKKLFLWVEQSMYYESSTNYISFIQGFFEYPQTQEIYTKEETYGLFKVFIKEYTSDKKHDLEKIYLPEKEYQALEMQRAYEKEKRRQANEEQKQQEALEIIAKTDLSMLVKIENFLLTYSSSSLSKYIYSLVFAELRQQMPYNENFTTRDFVICSRIYLLMLEKDIMTVDDYVYEIKEDARKVKEGVFI